MAEPEVTSRYCDSKAAGVALFIMMLVACAAPVWVADYFPSQNGPWYLLAAHVMEQYDNPDQNYSDVYVRHWHPIPHMSHTFLMYAFNHVLPVLTAQKMAITVYVVGLPLSIFYFLSVAAPQRRFLGFFAFLMVHNYTFYRGYHNFSLSIPCYFFALGYWLRHKDSFGWKQVLLMAPLISATYLSHLFTFLLLACSIGWYRWIETGSFLRGTRSAIEASWIGWLLLIDFIVLNSQVNSWADREELEFLPPHTAVEYFFYKYFYSMSVPAYILGSLMSLWVAYLMWRRFSEPTTAGVGWLKAKLGDPMVALATVLFVSYFFFPYKIVNWHYANARILPFIFGISLACAGTIPKWGRHGRGFQVAFLTTVCGAAIGIDICMAREVVHAQTAINDYISGIDSFEENSLLLPIHLENPPTGQVRPLTRAHEYYHIAKGGANGYGAAFYNTLVPIWYREYPVTKLFPRYDPKAPAESMKRIVETYGFVLVYGSDEELFKQLADNNFKLVHEKGKTHLFRNQAPKFIKQDSR